MLTVDLTDDKSDKTQTTNLLNVPDSQNCCPNIPNTLNTSVKTNEESISGNTHSFSNTSEINSKSPNESRRRRSFVFPNARPIPRKENENGIQNSNISRSWENHLSHFQKRDRSKYSISPVNGIFRGYRANKKYNAVNMCKSAGIIPYTFHEGNLYFLFQHTKESVKKKDLGWNDFGGKRIDDNETTYEIAAREFSEETSCLFYLKENKNGIYEKYYDSLKDNNELKYNDKSINILKHLIPLSQKFYTDKITEFPAPLYVSSKETYISYFVKVDYIPETDLPRAEDIHIPYDYRYIRMCKWFSVDEVTNSNKKIFHKRLQITRLQQRIKEYYDKGLFT